MNTIQSLLAETKKRTTAFTIVELLVVIGIISVLAVALLVTLNPAEAQRRSRDSKRVKDATTLQALIEQVLNDGNTLPAACATSPFCNSNTLVPAGTALPNNQNCAATDNWLRMDMCVYARSVPSDPVNQANRSCEGVTGACSLFYELETNTEGDYEIRVRQEASANGPKMASDGGGDAAWLEIISDTDL